MRSYQLQRRNSYQSDSRKSFYRTLNNPTPNHYLSQGHQLQRLSRNTTPNIDIDTLISIFSQHFLTVQSFFKTIQQKLAQLQSKIAHISGEYGKIQWRLSKQLYAIEQAKALNNSLIKMNQQVEGRLEDLKKEYEELRKRKYIGVLEQKIGVLQEATSKMEIAYVNSRWGKNQLQFIQENIGRLEEMILAEKGGRRGSEQSRRGSEQSRRGSEQSRRGSEQSRREVYEDIIVDLIGLLRQEEQIGLWIQQKTMENIRLKFQLSRKTTNKHQQVVY